MHHRYRTMVGSQSIGIGVLQASLILNRQLRELSRHPVDGFRCLRSFLYVPRVPNFTQYLLFLYAQRVPDAMQHRETWTSEQSRAVPTFLTWETAWCSAGLVDDDNIFEWAVTVMGPPDTL